MTSKQLKERKGEYTDRGVSTMFSRKWCSKYVISSQIVSDFYTLVFRPNNKQNNQNILYCIYLLKGCWFMFENYEFWSLNSYF